MPGAVDFDSHSGAGEETSVGDFEEGVVVSRPFLGSDGFGCLVRYDGEDVEDVCAVGLLAGWVDELFQF